MAQAAKARISHRSFGDLWRSFLEDLFEGYRPERHYMRGPGPKWRQRHAQDAGTVAAETPSNHGRPLTA